MSVITGVHARETLDSRGGPAIEAEVWLESGAAGTASAPAMAVRGGRGVLKAVENVNDEIEPELLGLNPSGQAGIDSLIIRFGADAALCVSLAVARAAAAEYGMPLWVYLGGLGPHIPPVPWMNAASGVREYMLVPLGASSFGEALRMGAETYRALGKILKKTGRVAASGGEGSFAAAFGSDAEALGFLTDAITEAGYEPGTQAGLAMDAAAGECYRDGAYDFDGVGLRLGAGDLADYYRELCSSYPIVSIENGVSEEDRDGWALLNENIGGGLFAAKTVRLAGTLTETLGAIEAAKKTGRAVVVSGGGGETSDAFIADLAVGTAAGRIRAGAPGSRSGVAIWNRLLRIEEALGGRAKYGGWI
jgi:enolase